MALLPLRQVPVCPFCYYHAQMDRKQLVNMVNSIEDYTVAHPWPPACACGCGEPVPFKKHSPCGPRMYVNRSHQPPRERGAEALAITMKGVKIRQRKKLPIEDFRRAMFKVKEAKGYTWDEIGDIIGYNPATVRYWMYTKKVQCIFVTTAEHIFRRLAGMATPPTSYELRGSPRKPRSKTPSPLEAADYDDNHGTQWKEVMIE